MKYSFTQAIQEIKNRTDIVSIVGRYVSLKRSGANYVAVCPFHDDTKPSMHVNPSREIYKCFACGAGGDLLKFVMDKEKMSFSETVHQLAKECGIEIEKKQKVDTSSPHYEVCEFACKFYSECLYSNEGAESLRYLTQKRQLTKETIDLFRLGYGTSQTNTLARHLQKQGFSEDILIESGLCLRSKYDETKLVDRFWGRIIIPIFNNEGKVIAFGSRSLHSDQHPKYINSSDTPIFQKGYNLYNIHNAKKHSRLAEKILLLEGYFDVMQAHQNNIPYAVASLGTAFTQEQAQMLYNSNLSRCVVLGFDNDEAGLKATQKALMVFQELDVSENPDLKMLQIEAKDIDEYLLSAGGSDTIQSQIEQSPSAYEFLIRKKRSQTDLEDITERQKSVDSLVNFVQGIRDPLYLEIVIEVIAREFQLTKSTLLEKCRSFKKPTPQSSSTKKNKKTASLSSVSKLAIQNLLSLLFLVDDGEVIKFIREYNIDDSYLEHIRALILEMEHTERESLLSAYISGEGLDADTIQFKDILEIAAINKSKKVDLEELKKYLEFDQKAFISTRRLRRTPNQAPE